MKVAHSKKKKMTIFRILDGFIYGGTHARKNFSNESKATQSVENS